MGERSVVRGDKRWSVAAEPGGGEVTLSATPPGPFAMDVDTAEEACLLFVAAIRTARGEQP
jgi:hypothetical protein